MAAPSNIPKEIQDSIKDVMDRRIKLGIKRMVRQEIRNDRTENRILAFSPCRLFVLAAKVPSKLEHTFHYLDIQAIESRKPNQLQITVDSKIYSFITQDADTDEVNHMITHIGTSLKNIFPSFPLERIILKIDVQPVERLKTMYDMMKDIESKELGPCGGFTMMYACMCDYHSLPYREEVAWDVDTIYLSQDSRELCLRDFDHLNLKDLIPIIGALEHNSWFTKLNTNNVKLTSECCNEILKVMRRNAVIEHLGLSNTGIKVEFVQKLSTAILSNSGTQISKIDLSNNILEDRGIIHLVGSLSNLSKGLTSLDLSKTGLTTKCLNRIAESMSQSSTISSTLQTLKLADNSLKAEDLSNLYTFLARPNGITHLDLSSTDIALDMICGALLRGCIQQLTYLKLNNVVFSHKKSKEVIIPQTWKQLFSSVAVLEHLDLSNCKLPPEAVRELLLGVASNRHIDNLHLDLSNNDLGSQGAQNIGDTIANIINISSLDISNNGFDQDLGHLLQGIKRNRSIRHIAIGRNFTGIKPKYHLRILDHVVQLIQEEDSMIQSISLVDSKLKADTAYVVNALGSNNSLREIDLSGNLMGDLGARMLAKALQINTHMQTVRWDRNATSAQGFEDIADALEKNYTLKKMPFPVNDAAIVMRSQPERTEAALQKIESLLQRNHNPRKFSSDQAYRLQQGFLLSSTQQMVDRLVVQVQDTINALNFGPNEAFKTDIQKATEIVKDADNSKQLLPRLQEIAIKSQDSGNPVDNSLQKIADDLRQVMENQMKKSVEDMLKCTASHCTAVTADKTFQTELEDGCHSKSSIPKDFTKLMLDGVGNDMYNKLSELNLAVAAYLSDSTIDQVIEVLSNSHRTLTNHLNLRKSGHYPVKEEKVDTETEKKASRESLEIELDNKPSPGPFFMDSHPQPDSPKLSHKRKSLYGRKLRPQSVIDRDQVQKALKMCEIETEKNSVDSHSDIRSQIEEVDELNLSFEKLDSLDESSERKKSTDSSFSLEKFDGGNEDSTEAKPLKHLVKSRPKRQKTRAPTRPVAPGITPLDNATDDGIGAFYVPPTISAEPITSSPSRKSSDTSTKSSGNQLQKPTETPKSEKKKGWSPRNLMKDKDKDKDKEKEKEKEKDKGEKKGSLLSHGLSNFFGRKSGGKGKNPIDPEAKKLAESPPTIPEEKKTPVKQQQQQSTVSYNKKSEEVDVDQSEVKAPIVSAECFDDEKTHTEKGQEKEKEEDLSEEKETNDTVGKIPASSSRTGMGLGGNILLEMKQKQEKRFSQQIKPRTSPKEKDDHEANNNVIDKNKAQKTEENKTVLKPAKNETTTTVDNGSLEASDVKSSSKSDDTKRALIPNANKASSDVKKPLCIPVEPVLTEKSPRAPPRALQPPKKRVSPTQPADTEATVTLDTKPTVVPRSVKPPPPTKPRPPALAPKPRASLRTSKDVTDSNIQSEEVKLRDKPEGQIVTDSATLRLSVREKIKRLSKAPIEESPLISSPTKSKSNSTDSKPHSSSDEGERVSSPSSLDSIDGETSNKDCVNNETSPQHKSSNSIDSTDSVNDTDKNHDDPSPKEEHSVPKRSSRAEDEIMV
ncbi:F-actin-uncapping protein LRRC16A isoform X3 [Patella vulgata]|uniref:F-actin-uncapping protein LRRC16A isoform X3 n=1 Tax=Patella vulgata TaxID=6465 RepID=UPI0021809067|nr:F-actin-uncapping protein LRRC16A isoform X3 [Patella vulgata]